MSTSIKVSKWFWVIAILSLLWNLGGLFQFLSATVLKDGLYATLTEPQIALFENLPTWYLIIFGIAVIAGVLASIILLLKRKQAILLYLISAIAVLIQMSYWVFATQVIEVYGFVDAVTMPVIVVITGFSLWLYSRMIYKKGWLS